MKYLINYGNAVITLPRDTVIDKLSSAGETELKFLIRFLACPSLQTDYEANADALCEELKTDRSALDAALAFWRGAGVICPDGNSDKASVRTERKVARHASIPNYTGEELSRIIDENGLSCIIDECQRLMGKVFNITEVNRIAALTSYLGLSGEYILTLFAYCAEHNKLSLKYAEKLAYNLYDKGIDNIEALEEYIKLEEEKRSLETRLRVLFGWGDRGLTPTEKKHIATWSDEYSYTLDIITEAYNITVENTGKLALPYLSKILANWHSKGYRNLDDVRNALNEYEKSKQDKQSEEHKDSFDVDEFFELALKRSREMMTNYNGG